MRKAISLLAFTTCSVVAGSAAADPETHDGLFLRLGLNIGPGSATQEIEAGGQTGPETTISGLGMGFDLLIGGTLAPGFTLGGALVGTTSSDPTVKQGNLEATADGSMLFAGAAVFGNYYLDPTKGLHFQGLLGFGALDFVSESGASGGNDPTGPFFGAGVGYDFWIGDEWSIGPFGRVIYGSLSAESGGATLSASYLYPSIGAAFTLH